MSSLAARRTAAGFTLIELLTVMTIAAVFAVIAVPSFRNFIAGQNVKTAASDVTFTLLQARSEAIKRNARVVIAPAAGGWQAGWAATTGTVTLAQHEGLNNVTITGPSPSVTYGSDGRLALGSAASNFSIAANSGASVAARCVSLDLSGMPSVKTGAC